LQKTAPSSRAQLDPVVAGGGSGDLVVEALAAARLSVQLDRFQDLAWQLLVELHEESGDSSAAALARRDHAQAQAEPDSVT